MSRASGGDLRVGESVEVAIEKAVYRGRGLGRIDGRVVFVARSYPGDRVRARVSAVHSGWADATIEEVLVPAPSRRVPPCPQGTACGGCTYQDVAYDEQLRLKEAVLREALARAGVPDPGAIRVHPSPERAWRLRASLHFACAGGVLRLGFRREGSHRVIDHHACLQLSDAMNAVTRDLRDALTRRPGLFRRLRGLDLLESPDGSGLVAMLVTTLRAHEAPALEPLGRQVPGLTGFGVECEPRRLQWLHGDPRVGARVMGLDLRTHVRSFFQANRFLIEPLAREVTGLVARDGGQILDLYAGVGLFAAPLAARGDVDVVAVEHAGSAAEDARANAARNGLSRLRVISGDVREALSTLPRQPKERVVLDPPRTGAGTEVVDLIAERRPAAVVYVSCDPPTLGRDLARFARRSYAPDSVQLFDLFPGTFHLETVVRLIRSDAV